MCKVEVFLCPLIQFIAELGISLVKMELFDVHESLKLVGNKWCHFGIFVDVGV